MTEPEVVAILGCDAGDYGPGKAAIVSLPPRFEYAELVYYKQWLAGDVGFTITFDGTGRVCAKHMEEVVRVRERTFLEKACVQLRHLVAP